MLISLYLKYSVFMLFETLLLIITKILMGYYMPMQKYFLKSTQQSFSFFKDIYLFIFREREREGEREGKKY